MDNIVKKEVSASKNTMGLAPSVLYLSQKYNECITQSKIAEAAGVSSVTLRHSLNFL